MNERDQTDQRPHLGAMVLEEARQLGLSTSNRLVSFAIQVEDDPYVAKSVEKYRTLAYQNFPSILAPALAVYKALAAIAFISGEPSDEEVRLLETVVKALMPSDTDVTREKLRLQQTLTEKLGGRELEALPGQEKRAVRDIQRDILAIDFERHSEGVNGAYRTMLKQEPVSNLGYVIDLLQSDLTNSNGIRTTTVSCNPLARNNILLQFLEHARVPNFNLGVLAYALGAVRDDGMGTIPGSGAIDEHISKRVGFLYMKSLHCAYSISQVTDANPQPNA